MAKSTTLAFFSALLLTAGGFAGCDIDVEIGETETTGESSSSSGGPQSSSTTEGESMSSQGETEPGATVGTGTEGSEGTEGNEETGVMSDSTDTSDPDFGGVSSCDPLLQDCDKGEGCYLTGEEYECVPAGDGGAGDPCEFVNECLAGYFCVAGPDGNVCGRVCDPADANSCGDDDCEQVGPDASVGVCTPGGCGPGQIESQGQCYDVCDPLLQDCLEGETCVPTGDDAFACFPAAGSGEQGDGCEFVNTCEPGLFCMPGTLLPGSEEPSACTTVCDVSSPSCPSGLDCIAFFPEGSAPAGSENVGVCGVEA